MKKRLYTLLATVILTFSCFFANTAVAQNRIFEKYSDMEDVEYICITRSMLKMLSMGNGSLNVNGVNVKGLTDAIKVLVIVNSDNKDVCKQMKSDFQALKADSNYEMLMLIKDDKSVVTTLYNDSKTDKELVMYINEDDSQTFIIITGKLNEDIVNKLISK